MQFFSSDHLFDCQAILRGQSVTRAYRSLGEMQRAFVARWNQTVGPGDTVWYLGDLASTFEGAEEVLQWLNGTKHLVVGDRDACFAMSRCDVRRYLDAGFSSVRRKASFELRGQLVALNHFPYGAVLLDGQQDKFAGLRFAEFACIPSEWGEQALIHGHVRDAWRARVGPSGLPELNVSVDAWDGRPVSECELLDLYSSVLGHGSPGFVNHMGTWSSLSAGEGGYA